MEAESGTVMNSGNPEKYEIREVARIIAEMTNVGIECVPRDEGDITERIPDIDFALSFSWQPKINLREGLERTIEWAKDVWRSGVVGYGVVFKAISLSKYDILYPLRLMIGGDDNNQAELLRVLHTAKFCIPISVGIL